MEEEDKEDKDNKESKEADAAKEVDEGAESARVAEVKTNNKIIFMIKGKNDQKFHKIQKMTKSINQYIGLKPKRI